MERVGIHILHDTIYAAAVTGGPAGWRVLSHGVLVREHPGEELTPEDARRLESMLFRRGMAGLPCVVSPPAGALRSASLRMPPASSGAPIERLARAELARLHRLEEHELEVRIWQADEPRAGTLAIGCLRAEAARLTQTLNDAGVTVCGMEDPATALAGCLPQPQGDTPPPLRAIVAVHGRSALAAIVRNTTPVFIRKLDLPAGDAAPAAGIAAEVRACVAFVRHSTRSSEPFDLTLAGEAGGVTAEAVGAHLGAPVRAWSARGTRDPALAVAVGLALPTPGGAHARGLLPDAIAERVRARRVLGRWLASAAAIGLVGGAGALAAARSATDVGAAPVALARLAEADERVIAALERRTDAMRLRAAATDRAEAHPDWHVLLELVGRLRGPDTRLRTLHARPAANDGGARWTLSLVAVAPSDQPQALADRLRQTGLFADVRLTGSRRDPGGGGVEFTIECALEPGGNP